MVLSLFSAKHKFLETIQVDEVVEFEAQLHSFFKEEYSNVLQEIETKKMISEELHTTMMQACERCVTLFHQMKGH